MDSATTLILVFCLGAFATLHSLTASLSFKRFVVRKAGGISRVENLYMPGYSLVAFVTIAPLVYLLLKNPGPTLYVLPSPWRWLMISGQGITALATSKALLDAPHRFKLRAQLAAPKTPEAGELNIKGIYRWLRDPFLLSGLIILWLTPFMTLNLLLIYILTSGYLYLGSLHWEKRLISQFGEEYRKYQKRVHRIIPSPDFA